nr:MAG TPA: hypothetical protein [Caudoviricetes sp.]
MTITTHSAIGKQFENHFIKYIKEGNIPLLYFL